MNSETDPSVTGRCLCGDIRFRYWGAPIKTLHCHCESCRRHVSGPIATFVCVNRDTTRFTGAEPKVYASSAGVRRTFCGRCGSPIAYESDRKPQQIDLYVGALDDPAVVAPTYHVHAAEQLPWFETADTLPRYERDKEDAVPLRHGPRAMSPETA